MKTQQEITIKTYTTSNKPHVLDLLRLNTPAYFAPDEEKDFLFYLDHELEQYFVVAHENKIIGCGGINFSKDKSTGKISWDMLHPDYQGKGIGSMLLNYRIEKLRALEQIKTVTVRTSQLAYLFYEKAGFQLVEIKKDHWAKGFDLYEMNYTIA